MGLQSDGTAIIGDVLRVSYGVTFGTPSAVSWYKNGSVVHTASIGDGVDDMLNFEITAAEGAGTYTATVVAGGITYQTNEIVVTTAEEAAEIIDFYIEDDYTDGTDIDYDTKDTKAIATVVLKKNYDGKILIYKENDNKFKGAIDKIATSTDVAEEATKYYVDEDENGGNHAITAGGSVLTTDQATNFQVSNLATGGAGVGHINADGSVTYKFVVDGGILTRGQNYVAVFDQASVVTDTPGNGIANVYDEPATVPYVEEPAAIAVTKVSAGNYPEVSFLDEDGNTLTWFGEAKKKLSDSGIAKGEIYYATFKTNDPDDGTAQKVAITTPGNVEKGVWKSNEKAKDVIDAYWYATVTTKKGIFGEKAVTLISEAVPVAQKSADTINLVESSSDPEAATVKFTNLRNSGTVYVVRGLKYSKNGTAWDNTVDYHSTPANIFKAYEAGINEAIVGKASVEAGTDKVDIAQAIGEFVDAGASVHDALNDSAGYYGVNTYIAVFVPDDEDNYGMIYTANGLENKATKEDSTASNDSQGLSLTQVATSIKYDKTTRAGIVQSEDDDTLTITGTTLVAYDQFGNKMTTKVDATDVTTATFTPDALSAIDQGVKGQYSVAADSGQVTIVLTTKNDTKATAKDKYTVTLLGSTITLEALAEVTDVDRDEDESKLVWNAKFGSDNLIDNDEVVTLAGLTLTQAVVTTPAAGVTITVSGTAGIVTAPVTATGDANVASSVDGRVITLTPTSDTDAATVTVIITGSKFTRTVTYEATTGGAAWTPESLTVDTDVVTANA